MMSWHVSLLLGTTALFCIRIDHGPGKLLPLGNSKPPFTVDRGCRG